MEKEKRTLWLAKPHVRLLISGWGITVILALCKGHHVIAGVSSSCSDHKVTNRAISWVRYQYCSDFNQVSSLFIVTLPEENKIVSDSQTTDFLFVFFSIKNARPGLSSGGIIRRWKETWRFYFSGLQKMRPAQCWAALWCPPLVRSTGHNVFLTAL